MSRRDERGRMVRALQEMRFPRERNQEISSACVGAMWLFWGVFQVCQGGSGRHPAGIHRLLSVFPKEDPSALLQDWFSKDTIPICGLSQSGMHLYAKPAKNGWWRCSRKRHKLQDHARLFRIIHSIIPCDTLWYPVIPWHCLHKWNLSRGCGPRFRITWQLGEVSTHLEGAASHRSTSSFWKPWFRNFLSQRVDLHLFICYLLIWALKTILLLASTSPGATSTSFTTHYVLPFGCFKASGSRLMPSITLF